MNVVCELNTVHQPPAKLRNQGILNIVRNENNFILGKTEFMLMQVIQSIYQNIVN